VKLALGDFIAAIVFAHVFLDKFYLSPEISQLIAVIEAHKYTSFENITIILKLDGY
jgi:hypothetical protein